MFIIKAIFGDIEIDHKGEHYSFCFSTVPIYMWIVFVGPALFFLGPVGGTMAFAFVNFLMTNSFIIRHKDAKTFWLNHWFFVIWCAILFGAYKC
jgi:hypothetical protein